MTPDTPQTLLRKISEFADGDDSAEWERFAELYTPVIRRYADELGGVNGSNADDVVQEVMIRLVDVLRGGGYKREKGRFRSYLYSMVRRLLVDMHRRAAARGEGRTVPIDGLEVESGVMDAATIVDVRLRAARHAAAVEHVLSRTMLDPRTVAAYRAYALDCRPAEEVAAAHDLKINALRQIKHRIDRMIAAVESAYCE
jgi:RNA polymerase sigma factor (sigma-70 family)